MKSLKSSIVESIVNEAKFEKLNDEVLTYRNQLDFKNYFVQRAKAEGYKKLAKGKLSFQKTPFEFDHTTAYDSYTEKNIPNVNANGDLTFDAAYNTLVEYYKETQPNLFK